MRLHRLVFILLNMACGLTGRAQPARAPLQIILIVADDLGWKDVGFMGSRYYQTPHLDKLARQSVVFTNAYANASNCAPSRACLLTGRTTPAHGIYTVGTSERGHSKTRKLIPTPNQTDLDTNTTTLADVLGKAGFHTAVLGKWHLGDNPRPLGFALHKGGGSAGSPITYFSPYHLKYLADGTAGEELTDRITTEAIDYITEKRTSPFFLYLPHFAIHTPLQGKPDLVSKYKQQESIDGQGGNAHYAALVENLDSNIGRLLRSVDSLKLTNVLVIFTSDNGGIADLSRQWPLRSGKGSYYEGGVRVPLLIYDPQARLTPRTVDTPVQLIDLLPTLAERAGTPLPAPNPFEGKSIRPLLRGEPSAGWPERPLFWHFPIYLEAYQVGGDDSQDPLFRTRPGSALRLGQWKLIQYFENNTIELYDLRNDPGERINLATKNPKKTTELLAVLRNWQQRTKAPIPTQLNPDFDATYQPPAKPER